MLPRVAAEALDHLRRLPHRLPPPRQRLLHCLHGACGSPEPERKSKQDKKKSRPGTGAKPKSKRAESVRFLPLEDEEAGPRDTYWLDSAAAAACVGESDVSFSLQVTVF
jgi:hypothetical protein